MCDVASGGLLCVVGKQCHRLGIREVTWQIWFPRTVRTEDRHSRHIPFSAFRSSSFLVSTRTPRFPSTEVRWKRCQLMLQSTSPGSGRRSTSSPAKCLQTDAFRRLASPSLLVWHCTIANAVKSPLQNKTNPVKSHHGTLISFGIKPVAQSELRGIQRGRQVFRKD